MYSRFTDRARKVIQLTKEEARRQKQEFIGTEHLLLGLLREGTGVAGSVLLTFGVNLHTVQLEVEKIIPAGEKNEEIASPTMTPRTKKAIEYALDEARILKNNYVGTEHLLLGLLREDEGVAAQILMNLGLRFNDVREEVLGHLGYPPSVVDADSPIYLENFQHLPKSAQAVVAAFDCQLTNVRQEIEEAEAVHSLVRAVSLRDVERKLKSARAGFIRQWTNDV